MRSQHWTDEQVADIPTPRKSPKIYKLTDDGLYLKVYKTGSRSFGYQATNAAGHYQFYPWGQHAPSDARTPETLTFHEAYEKLLAHKLTLLTQKSGHALPPKALIDKTTTLGQLAADYFRKDVETRDISTDHKNRIMRTLTNYFLNQPVAEGVGKWRDVLVVNCARGDVHEQYTHSLMKVQDRAAKGGDRRGKCTLAKECDTFARGLFAFACTRQLLTIESVPPKLKKANAPRNVSRWLPIIEIESLLKATSPQAIANNDARRRNMGEYELTQCDDKLLDTFGAVFLRLTLATGLRIDSMRLARREMLNKHSRGMWTIRHVDLKETAAQKQAPTDHYIPLTPFILRELARLDDLSGEHDFLFTERWIGDGTQVEPRSKSWASHLVGKHDDELSIDPDDPWRAHALRRSHNDWMQELGVPTEVIHKASARMPQGLAKTYLVSEMRDHVVDAFEKYHDFLDACEHGKGEDWMADIRGERLAARRQVNEARRARLGLPAL
jgi:integrase